LYLNFGKYGFSLIIHRHKTIIEPISADFCVFLDNEKPAYFLWPNWGKIGTVYIPIGMV